jgi:hypothetical protein
MQAIIMKSVKGLTVGKSLLRNARITSNRTNLLEKDINNAIRYLSVLKNQQWEIPYGESFSECNTELAKALIHFKDNLQISTEEDNTKIWMAEGISMFSDLIKRHNGSIESLCNLFISKLSVFVKANAALIYVTNNDDETNPFIECKGSFVAKPSAQRIPIDSGILGQSYSDGNLMYLDNVPKGYLKIQSGLGESEPSYIILCPLKLFGTKVGIIELASFEPFPQYKINFINQLSENIAAAISHSQAFIKTSQLLNDSQLLTTRLREQEDRLKKSLSQGESLQIELMSQNEKLQLAKQQIENKSKELEEQRKIDSELLESKLKAQEEIYSTIIQKMRSKIHDLQKQSIIKTTIKI